ncbi:MAG: V-type ATP synthase subunit I, partial [Calditrichia bacterium]
SNQIFMMYLCFLIGVIHLTIAHSIVALRFINSLIALAQLGWICILWALFFVAGKIVIGNSLPQITGILFLVGITLVGLFSNPQKNVLKGTLVSLGELPLKVISSFSDVVSYVRLFAVGYASVIVATSFNNMALGIGFNSIFSSLISAVVLFLGHSLNVLLGLMAVIVHGVRLNMLEFSGHLNMQWSGKEYRPFRE